MHTQAEAGPAGDDVEAKMMQASERDISGRKFKKWMDAGLRQNSK